MNNNYKTKVICLLCLFATLFSNCKKSELTEGGSVITNRNGSAYAGDKKYHVLGAGYDVTGRLASSESSRLQVIDVEKYISENPGLYLPNEDVLDYYEFSSGENVSSYSDKLSQVYKATSEFGLLKIKVFKAEINASFAKKDSASSKYVYSTIRKMIKQKSMKIFFTKDDIINNYLTNTFKSDVATLPATELIKRYGTHVLTDIELGARFDMNYQAQTNSNKREEAAAAGANISMGKIFSLNANVNVNRVEASSNFNQTLYYNSVGGDGTKGLIDEVNLDNSAPKLSISNWQSSCTKDNAALIKIGEDGLIPLEDLIADPVRKQQIKEAILQYYKDNQFKSFDDLSKTFPADWASRALLMPYGKPTNAICTSLQPILTSNGNNTISSPNGKYRFVLQGDGNLVLYNSANVGLWNSKTNSTASGWVYKLYYALDGNLIIKKVSATGTEQDIWAAYTEARGGTVGAENANRAYMVVQDDGNVALYYSDYNGAQYSLEYSTATAGGKMSSRQGSFK
ncbi:MAC/perforin domain-containing protein [Pedobacter sp. AW31-3R]|uniref:MAC/perforin domain-containing protein n=1 Tax=Pedobacter sp. AW31-3R TaxID=3445781 RepID=UPI003FA0F28A